MGVHKPDDISAAFAAAFNARDARRLGDLYEDGAILTQDGKWMVTGREALTAVIAKMVKTENTMAIECQQCLAQDRIALVRSAWRLLAPDGSEKARGISAEVLRQGGDGTWRLAIDDASYASRASA